MGEHNRRRHQLRCFVAGETEHQPLVPRPLLRRLLAFGRAGVNALRDIGALARHQIGDENLVRVKNIVVIHIADVGDRFADDVR